LVSAFGGDAGTLEVSEAEEIEASANKEEKESKEKRATEHPPDMNHLEQKRIKSGRMLASRRLKML
jgi:hypothetical protein